MSPWESFGTTILGHFYLINLLIPRRPIPNAWGCLKLPCIRIAPGGAVTAHRRNASYLQPDSALALALWRFIKSSPRWFPHRLLPSPTFALQSGYLSPHVVYAVFLYFCGNENNILTSSSRIAEMNRPSTTHPTTSLLEWSARFQPQMRINCLRKLLSPRICLEFGLRYGIVDPGSVLDGGGGDRVEDQGTRCPSQVLSPVSFSAKTLLARNPRFIAASLPNPAFHWEVWIKKLFEIMFRATCSEGVVLTPTKAKVGNGVLSSGAAT
ncbi:hypothetical protein B0H14DRAFT_2599103 [Mycena olivaceomarginata]|nr:hypothetical protein B0H14DRAFT_2599103 [Mycena olivaceomarginata]